MMALVIGVGPILVCVISPLFMVGRVEGDEREPIIRWRHGS
jgi:hypothetical protein